MREINPQELHELSGGQRNIEICVGVTALAFGATGAAIGGSGTFGFGTGFGFTAGLSLGTAIGQTFCSSYFSD